ncbi:MAG: hypothetical protein WA869_12345 [Alloacidobacterium sp.]
MIGTLGAAWLACLMLLLIGVIGAAVGYLVRRITRKTSGIRGAAADGATAIAVAFIYGAIAAEVLAARGIWRDISEQTIIVGTSSVILKHTLLAAFRSRHQA